MKKIIFVFLLFLLATNVYSQRDTEFWFTAPNISGHSHGVDNHHLYFIAYENPVHVRITQPAGEDPFISDLLDFTPIEFTIKANSFFHLSFTSGNHVVGEEYEDIKYGNNLLEGAGVSYKINRDRMELTPQNSTIPYGVRIASDKEMSVYYKNPSDNYESYTLKGRNGLGTDFVVPMQWDYANSSYSTYSGSRAYLDIVASEDGTEVTITVPEAGLVDGWETTETSRTIRLQRGWAYSIKTKDPDGNKHLHGTRITSNRPISVSYTDDSLPQGGEDLLADQLVPVAATGMKYIAVTNNGQAGFEKLYILPTEDDTRVTIYGQTDGATLKYRERLDIGNKLSQELDANKAYYVTSTKPIVVFQLTASGGGKEPGGVMLPRLDCTGSKEIVAHGTKDNTYLNIVVKKEDIDGFSLYRDGVLITSGSEMIVKSDFKPVPNTNDEYYWAKKKVRKNSVFRVKNDGLFSLAVFDSSGNSTSYAYFTEYQPLRLNPANLKDYYVEGESLLLFLPDADLFENVKWYKDNRLLNPNGEKEYILDNITEKDAGVYKVTAEYAGNKCDVFSGYISVSVYKANIQPQEICLGETAILQPQGEAPFTWDPEPDEYIPGSNAVKVSPLTSTTYKVTNFKAGISKIVLNGDFEYSTGWANEFGKLVNDLEKNAEFVSAYTYKDLAASEDISIPGTYTITPNAKKANPAYDDVYDYTTGRDIGKMRGMLVANCSSDQSIIWSKNLAVNPNTEYKFTACFISPKQGSTPAELSFVINNQKQGDVIIVPGNGTGKEDWLIATCRWNSEDYTSATIGIIANDNLQGGRGVCIDSIAFSPMYPVTDVMSVVVNTASKPIITGSPYICEGKTELDGGARDDGSPFDKYEWYRNSINEANKVGTERVLTVTEPGKYILDAMSGNCGGISDVFEVFNGTKTEVSLTTDLIEVCPTEPILNIGYNLLNNGKVMSYKIIFNEDAIAVGFEDIEVTAPDPSITNKELIIPLTGDITNIRPNIYQAGLLMVSDKATCDCDTIPLKIMIKYSEMLTLRWNDVLGVRNNIYNGGYTFSAYQWYRNGTPIAEEVGSYYYNKDAAGNGTPFNKTDRYSVLLTRNDDGVEVFSCDICPGDFINLSSKAVTSGAPSEVIPVRELSESGTATFWNTTGRIESIQAVSADNAQVQLPSQQGIYILQITAGSEQERYKVVVR